MEFGSLKNQKTSLFDMRFAIPKYRLPAVALVLFLSHASLQACPVCFAAPDSPESRGMTMAILFLLGTIGIVLCGIASFVMYLVARQKEPLQPHAEFSLEDQPATP